MMGFGRTDPGACLICGAAHCACGGPIDVVQLPQRDAVVPSEDADAVSTALGDGSDDRPFSTATYRGKKKR